MKRKRKATEWDEEKALRKKKSNVVKKVKERQRRSRITESISELKKLVPSCQQHKKLNQSLIMSLSVDYLQYLHKKVERLEAEKQRLLDGLPIDGSDLPYLPENPESTFTDYQIKKEREMDMELENQDESDEVEWEGEGKGTIGDVRTESVSSVPSVNSVVSQQENYHHGVVWDDGSGYGTVGGMLSQIPTMYMNDPIQNMDNMANKLNVPHDLGMLRGNDDYARENVGLPMFRGLENIPSSIHVPGIVNQHERNVVNYQPIDTFPSMGDIEDFGHWPLHSGILKYGEESRNRSYISTLQAYRENGVQM
jgi:hypothetical protein